MEEILLYIQNHLTVAPYLIFGLLLLAGLNIPVSEDAMIFISAVLAAKNPSMFWPLFTAVYGGAYCSDLICFCLGRFFGPQLLKIKWFASMVTPERLDKVSHFYQRYGFFTLLVGRFIPFGFRNALFLSAGFSAMKFIKFALADWIATTISVSFFFYLYFTFGEVVIEYVKKGNLILFSVFVIATLLFVLVRKKRAKSAT